MDPRAHTHTHIYIILFYIIIKVAQNNSSGHKSRSAYLYNPHLVDKANEGLSMRQYLAYLHSFILPALRKTKQQWLLDFNLLEWCVIGLPSTGIGPLELSGSG